jgi:hypothetical protein
MRATADRGHTIAVCAVCLCAALTHALAVRGAAPRSSLAARRLAIAMDEAQLAPLPQRPRRAFGKVSTEPGPTKVARGAEPLSDATVPASGATHASQRPSVEPAMVTPLVDIDGVSVVCLSVKHRQHEKARERGTGEKAGETESTSERQRESEREIHTLSVDVAFAHTLTLDGARTHRLDHGGRRPGRPRHQCSFGATGRAHPPRQDTRRACQGGTCRAACRRAQAGRTGRNSVTLVS